MNSRTLNNQHGMALGPILFIIAILAIIAAAIAAGTGRVYGKIALNRRKSNAADAYRLCRTD